MNKEQELELPYRTNQRRAEVSEATQMSDGQDWTEPIKLTAAECEQLNEALEGEQK